MWVEIFYIFPMENPQSVKEITGAVYRRAKLGERAGGASGRSGCREYVEGEGEGGVGYTYE